MGWIKNNNDENYDGDDKRPVTNDNPALERTDNEGVRAQKKTHGAIYQKLVTNRDMHLRVLKL